MHKLLSACLFLGLVNCGEVKQQQPPRIPDEHTGRDSDIQEQEKDEGAEPVEVKEETAEDKKLACCKQCVQGMEKDRTGDAAEKIPCSDFTADLEERCRKYFVKSPMTAAEAKTCVAARETAPEPAAPAPP
jgi:hypothetical protein